MLPLAAVYSLIAYKETRRPQVLEVPLPLARAITRRRSTNSVVQGQGACYSSGSLLTRSCPSCSFEVAVGIPGKAYTSS